MNQPRTCRPGFKIMVNISRSDFKKNLSIKLKSVATYTQPDIIAREFFD